MPASEIGLPNNPESSHRKGVVTRAVALWNQTNADHRLKVFEADDGFPFERFDKDLFQLLALAKPEPVSDSGAGQGIPNVVNGDFTVNGNLIIDQALLHGPNSTPVAGYLADGRPFYRWHKIWDIGPNTWANTIHETFHGIPGGIASNNRIINAGSGMIDMLADAGLAKYGGDDPVPHTLHTTGVIDDRLSVGIRVIGNEYIHFRIFSFIDYV